jgi:hypothetical protein
MNLDVVATINHGDIEGFKQFFLTHLQIHEIESQAAQKRFGLGFSTFGIDSPAAQEAWALAMTEKEEPLQRTLLDWLYWHQAVHARVYQAIVGATGDLDLSVVDFRDAGQFYSWMFAHQQLHDYEQQSLGVWP